MADRMTTVVSTYGPKLAAEFDLTPEQTAGVFGNLAHESGKFRFFKEIGSGANSGGRGWAQWTRERRIAFLGYCKAHRLDPTTDQASYTYLLVEFHGAYRSVVTALKKCRTVDAATTTVERLYEAAGRPMMSSRIALARQALAILHPGHPASVAPVVKRPARKPTAGKHPAHPAHHHGKW